MLAATITDRDFVHGRFIAFFKAKLPAN